MSGELLRIAFESGLRPNSLCNFLPESYRTFLVHPEEGRAYLQAPLEL